MGRKHFTTNADLFPICPKGRYMPSLLHLLVILLLLSLPTTTFSSPPAPPAASPSSPSEVQKLLTWAKQNGAYTHPSLVFRDGGMFADNGPINENEVIASIPTSLEYPVNNRTLDEFASAFISSRSDPSNFHHPYLSSLPTTCQNFACMSPDPTIFTLLGARNAGIESAHPVEASIITSRWFGTGLQPIMDLFNHDQSNPTQFVKLNTATNRYELRATHLHPQMSQVYNFYLDRNVLTMYRLYGFLDTSRELDCLTMRALRIGNPVQRVACIAYADDGVTYKDMADEILHTHRPVHTLLLGKDKLYYSVSTVPRNSLRA